MKRFCFLIVLLLLLQGCSDMKMSNPFEVSTASIDDVYFDEFQDVPIPSAMTVNRAKSMASVTSEGVKFGVLVAEGRMDKLSLTSATIHSMAKRGWTLRGMMHGSRSIQIFEKDTRFAVVCFYDQTISLAMEVWVVGRLPDGINTSSAYSSAPVAMPSTQLSPSGSEVGSSPLGQ